MAKHTEEESLIKELTMSDKIEDLMRETEIIIAGIKDMLSRDSAEGVQKVKLAQLKYYEGILEALSPTGSESNGEPLIKEGYEISTTSRPHRGGVTCVVNKGEEVAAFDITGDMEDYQMDEIVEIINATHLSALKQSPPTVAEDGELLRMFKAEQEKASQFGYPRTFQYNAVEITIYSNEALQSKPAPIDSELVEAVKRNLAFYKSKGKDLDVALTERILKALQSQCTERVAVDGDTPFELPWEDCLKIINTRAVDQILRNFSESPCEDEAGFLVRAIYQAFVFTPSTPNTEHEEVSVVATDEIYRAYESFNIRKHRGRAELLTRFVNELGDRAFTVTKPMGEK